MSLHKDQQRVQDALLPVLMEQAMKEDDDAAARDCTLLNRLLVQGPDPLFLMESSATTFGALCTDLVLTVSQGREAIENAHWQGPGALLSGDLGLPNDVDLLDEDMKGTGGLRSEREGRLVAHAIGLGVANLPLAWRQEILWLLLADCSDCTEEGYAKDVTLTERIQRAVAAINKVNDIALLAADVMVKDAVKALQYFNDNTPVRIDADGHPHTTVDHGFYVLYKRGHKCVAVDTPGPTFWGTTPDTTLAEQGITVDKEISPHFGLVFPKGDE